MQWVPTYVDILGIKETDKLAKKAKKEGSVSNILPEFLKYQVN